MSATMIKGAMSLCPRNVNKRTGLGKRLLSATLDSLIVGILAFGLVERAGAADDSAKGEVFQLREQSVFEPGNEEEFLRGQICRCVKKPFAEVKNYPAFKSDSPIYGSIRFGGRADDTNSGTLFYFALDESRGKGTGYDLLYFDSNQDLDLRNDPVGKPLKPPPTNYKPNFGGIKVVKCFDFLKLNLQTNQPSATPVEIMPRLLLTGDDKDTYPYVFFVRTHFFEGDITVGGEKFKAFLGNDYVITPDWNSPAAALHLVRAGGSGFNWWGGDRISAIHKVNGRFFTFSSTPDGKVTVQPYQGEFGTFEIGAGGRGLTNLSVKGSFEGPKSAVPVGGAVTNGDPVSATRCQLPVGDYFPDYITVEFGRLHIAISENYHSDGKRQDRGGRPPVYGINVRKDRPYVLDFSNKPDVMFASPAKDAKLKLGDTLSVMAVLIDPKLDIMIRGLDDTTRKTTTDPEGKPLGYERRLSLDPKVVITRVNGEKVAEGVMPFG